MKKFYTETAHFVTAWGIRKHIHNVKRKQLKNKQQRKNPHKVYVSEVVNMLGSSISRSPNIVRKKTITLSLPQNFSLIDNARESLKVILGFAKDVRTVGVKEIMYDHSKVNAIDLSAESLLAYIAGEIDKERARKRKILESGYYPKDEHVVRLIKSVGVIQSLNVTHEFLQREEAKGLRVFKKRSIYQGSTTFNTADFKERTIVDFVRHINDCLHDHGRKLKGEAVAKLCEYTGEIIANAEEHPGYRDWTIIGYLDNNNHLCEITIFNFGKPISQTLMELPRDSFTYTQIKPYIDAHRSKGFFGIGGWSEEDLLTLVALQGKVSSKNKSPEDDRGQGTVDLVTFFQKIHRECVSKSGSEAKMSIISGSTYILFDGKYQMAPDASGRPIVAFNSSNDLRDVPDRDYVQNLGDIKFPGTLIGIKFPMQIEANTEEVRK